MEKNDYCPISCSIGIALAPRDGADFTTLYQNADMAMYHAKAQGKDTYSFFAEEMDFSAGECPVVSTEIESEQGSGLFENHLVEYIFHALYRAEDIQKTIPMILEIIGRRFDVSRVYVFEFDNASGYARNIYEWCGEGVKPQIDLLQEVPVAAIEEALNLMRENDAFYAKDVSKLTPSLRGILEKQGIKSILQCAIRENGELCGSVGFDECRNNRFWAKEQIQMQHLIAEILSVFFLKGRKQKA